MFLVDFFYQLILNKEIYTQIIIYTFDKELFQAALQWLLCLRWWLIRYKTVPGHCCALTMNLWVISSIQGSLFVRPAVLGLSMEVGRGWIHGLSYVMELWNHFLTQCPSSSSCIATKNVPGCKCSKRKLQLGTNWVSTVYYGMLTNRESSSATT